jgi:hypothetical protein
MAITQSRVTVTTSATLLATSERRIRCRVQNPVGGATVQLGGAGVTVANGYDLVAGAAIEMIVEPNDPLYAVITAATQAIQVLYSEID